MSKYNLILIPTDKLEKHTIGKCIKRMSDVHLGELDYKPNTPDE